MANEFSKFTYGGTTYDIKDAVARANGVEYISGRVGDTPQDWLGTTIEDSLYEGKTILYRVPRDVPTPNQNIKLNLTYANGTTTGAKYVYRNVSTVEQSPYKASSILLLVYHAGGWRVTHASAMTQDLFRPTRLNGVNDPTLQGVINNTRANHWAFLPASQIIIEQTLDGGTTWTDAGVSDANKTALFSETRPTVYIPLVNGQKSLLAGVRITFTAMKYDVPDGTAETAKYNYWNTDYVTAQERYCNIKDIYFWVGSNTDTIGVKVEVTKPTTTPSWVTLFDSGTTWGMTGWSGNDYISFSQNLFGGGTNQTNQYWNWRITLMTRGVNGGDTLSGTNMTSKQAIYEIRGYGDSVWGSPNSYMMRDHLYSWDYTQNAYFPANVLPAKNNSGQVGSSAFKWSYVYTNNLSETQMVGTLKAKANQYYDANSVGGINMQNSDIYGINGLFMGDASESGAEGINFVRDSTHFDSIFANGGAIYFTPNRPKGTETTPANSQKVARFTTNPTTAQLVMTDGTTGGVVSTATLPTANLPATIPVANLPMDEDLSDESVNPVQNLSVANAIANLAQRIETVNSELSEDISALSAKDSDYDDSITNVTSQVNSLTTNVNGLNNTLSQINPEIARQIQEYTGDVVGYIWTRVVDGVTYVYKGIPNATLQDRQTATQWSVIDNNETVLNVQGGEATATTLNVTESLKLGNYTLTINSNGGWSLT